MANLDHSHRLRGSFSSGFGLGLGGCLGIACAGVVVLIAGIWGAAYVLKKGAGAVNAPATTPGYSTLPLAAEASPPVKALSIHPQVVPVSAKSIVADMTFHEKQLVFRGWHVNLLRAQNFTRSQFGVEYPPRTAEERVAFESVRKEFLAGVATRHAEIGRATLGNLTAAEIEEILTWGRRNGVSPRLDLREFEGQIVPRIYPLTLGNLRLAMDCLDELPLKGIGRPLPAPEDPAITRPGLKPPAQVAAPPAKIEPPRPKTPEPLPKETDEDEAKAALAREEFEHRRAERAAADKKQMEELLAANSLKLIKPLLKARPGSAKVSLLNLIQTYPHTKAAAESREILKGLP